VPRGATSHKTAMFIGTAVKTSNPTKLLLSFYAIFELRVFLKRKRIDE
jgi:hypothetical protein